MKGVRAAAFAAACCLAGCSAGPHLSGSLAAARPLRVEVRLRLAPPSPAPSARAPFALQAVVSGYTAADIDHVELTIHRAGQGVAVAVSRVPQARLGDAVTVRNLRADTAYEVRATAWADAAESRPLSAPAALVAAFQTPAVVRVQGLAQIDDAVIAVPLVLPLAPRVVAPWLTFKVTAAGNVRNRATHVRLRLTADGALVTERLETLAQAQASHTLSQLKLGTRYALVAQALTLAPAAQYSSDAASTFTFQTPAALGAGGVEEDLNALLGTPVASVPCAK